MKESFLPRQSVQDLEQILHREIRTRNELVENLKNLYRQEHTPQALSEISSYFWREIVGFTGNITTLTIDTEQIKEVEMLGQFIFYRPQEVTTEDISKFQLIKPEHANNSELVEKPLSGWVAVESSINAPLLDRREIPDEKHPEWKTQCQQYLIESKGRFGLDYITYCAASAFSKAITGRYFDEEVTASRLLGSKAEYGSKKELVSVVAHTFPGGIVRISPQSPGMTERWLGARSAQILQAP